MLFPAAWDACFYDLTLNVPKAQTRLRTELTNSEVSRVAG